MTKASSQTPRRQPTIKTTQFWLAFVGSWLVLTGWIGNLAGSTNSTVRSNPTSITPNSGLRVDDARQQPGAVINELQNAGGLQTQTGQKLQQPGQADLLQPNAKTDSLSSPTDSIPE